MKPLSWNTKTSSQTIVSINIVKITMRLKKRMRLVNWMRIMIRRRFYTIWIKKIAITNNTINKNTQIGCFLYWIIAIVSKLLLIVKFSCGENKVMFLKNREIHEMIWVCVWMCDGVWFDVWLLDFLITPLSIAQLASIRET